MTINETFVSRHENKINNKTANSFLLWTGCGRTSLRNAPRYYSQLLRGTRVFD